MISVDSFLVRWEVWPGCWQCLSEATCWSNPHGLGSDTQILKSRNRIFLVCPQIIWPLGLSDSYENSTGWWIICHGNLLYNEEIGKPTPNPCPNSWTISVYHQKQYFSVLRLEHLGMFIWGLLGGQGIRTKEGG